MRILGNSPTDEDMVICALRPAEIKYLQQHFALPECDLKDVEKLVQKDVDELVEGQQLKYYGEPYWVTRVMRKGDKRLRDELGPNIQAYIELARMDVSNNGYRKSHEFVNRCLFHWGRENRVSKFRLGWNCLDSFVENPSKDFYSAEKYRQSEIKTFFKLKEILDGFEKKYPSRVLKPVGSPSR